MKKILLQTVICLVLCFGYFAIEELNFAPFNTAKKEISAQLHKEYTPEEIKNGGRKAIETLSKMSSEVSENIPDKNYGEPIDEVFNGDTTLVYSVAGGTVTEVGENGDIGKYIIVTHGNNLESTYGNLSSIKVEKSQRVNKGYIIGSYNKETGKEFYYLMNKN